MRKFNMMNSNCTRVANTRTSIKFNRRRENKGTIEQVTTEKSIKPK